jgi:hypothetical protein
MRAKQLLQASSFHLRTRLSQFGYFVLPTTREWCFLVDTWAFFVTNPLGSPELTLDERFGLIMSVDYVG